MSCHTWVYKRISSMSKDEINREIDCVINERKQRFYMSSNEDEYANRMVKLTKDSSVAPMSYTDAVKRYKEAREETQLIIDKLTLAKQTGDLSVITYKNGFDTSEDDTYLFLCTNTPFRCYEYTDKQFTNKDELISYIHSVDPKKIEVYNNDKSLEEQIYDFFKLHGDNNLLFEFG